MPVFRGPRYRRYQSLDKILDLVEVASKSAPSFPRDAVFLNVYDDEWDDQMTYLSINYQWIFENALVRMGLPLALYVYNHNLIHYNIHYRMCKWFFPLVALYQFEVCYKYYRTQLQKALLFDEYCQARADELIAQREHLLYTPEMKKFLTWSLEFKDVMLNLKRDAYNNNPTDFKQSELRLQDFIRKWVDSARGITFPNAGPKYGRTIIDNNKFKLIKYISLNSVEKLYLNRFNHIKQQMATEISSIRSFDIDLNNQTVQVQDILHLWKKTYSQNQITPPKENSLIAKRELKAVWILRCLDKFMEQENPDINKFVNFLQTKNTELNEYLLQVLDKMFVLTTKEVSQIKNYLALRKLYSSSDMMQLIKYLCERCLARNQTKLLTKMIDFIQLEGKTQQYQVIIQEIYNKLALSHKFTQLKWEHRMGFLFVHKRSLQIGRLNHNLKRELSKYFSFF